MERIGRLLPYLKVTNSHLIWSSILSDPQRASKYWKLDTINKYFLMKNLLEIDIMADGKCWLGHAWYAHVEKISLVDKMGASCVNILDPSIGIATWKAVSAHKAHSANHSYHTKLMPCGSIFLQILFFIIINFY